jgi:NAD(P)-dependent dehydrogenase (short-subunit alcohol dehydrogenase family)
LSMPARYAEARNEVFPKIDRPGGSYRYEEQPSKGDKKMSNSSSKGTALITGASRGIGAVYAHRLAKRGFDLILVARSVEPLNALAASLSSASGRHITSIVADLNNETDLAKVETKLKDDPSITMLVNNAGFASVAPLLEADIRKMCGNDRHPRTLAGEFDPSVERLVAKGSAVTARKD